MKIQFGSGGNQLPGWINTELPEVDISKSLPYPDECADMILAEHVFEHVSPADGLRFLDECRRILKPDGVLRICVPVLDSLGIDHGRDIVFNHGHMAAYSITSLYHMIRLAKFTRIQLDSRNFIDHHWTVIGLEKDTLETARFNVLK